jgi:hypothetical protein
MLNCLSCDLGRKQRLYMRARSVCHLATHPGPAQLDLSAVSVCLSLYELANRGHETVYIERKEELREKGLRAVPVSADSFCSAGSPWHVGDHLWEKHTLSVVLRQRLTHYLHPAVFRNPWAVPLRLDGSLIHPCLHKYARYSRDQYRATINVSRSLHGLWRVLRTWGYERHLRGAPY